MRIVVDAMGTDQHPTPDVAGAVLAAAQMPDVTMVLVGDEPRIKAELAQHSVNTRLEIVHAPEAVSMTDKPSIVGKSKPQSSMHIGMNLVKNGDAAAFVTMGNTGAAHAIAMLYTLRRIPGVKRPALSGIFKLVDRSQIFLDIGANADSKAEWLAQFAVMGSVYAQNALHLPQPRVALLSNGEEEGKGTEAIREAAEILQYSHLNFTGNIEPKGIFAGEADVIVADGFTGNILTKTFETSTRYLTSLIREEAKRDLPSMAGAALLRPAFNRLRQRASTDQVGGAPLLGVQGVVIIGHGSANAIAVKNAIEQARQAADGHIIDAMRDAIRIQLAQVPGVSSAAES